MGIGGNVTKDKPEIDERMHVSFTSSETAFRRVNGASVPEPPKDDGTDVFVLLKGERGNMTNDLRIMLNPGNRLRINYGPGNVNNRIEHVRAVVDGDQVVVRVWSYRKKRWWYQVFHWGMYEVLARSGHVTLDGTDKE